MLFWFAVNSVEKGKDAVVVNIRKRLNLRYQLLPLHLLLSSGEKTADNLEIRIYEGATGEFTLYEDESVNYNYEKGICSTIKLIWNDAKNVDHIRSRGHVS